MSADQALFTCLSCMIAFPSAEDQRIHYRSDHHRYNMKRRVASLPPVSAAVFNQKVLERRQETSIMSSAKGSHCDVCNKTYTTENSYRSHIASKKHRENELKAAAKAREPAPEVAPVPIPSVTEPEAAAQPAASTSTSPPSASSAKESGTLLVDADADEEQVNQTIDEKIAAARSRLSPAHCLFCPQISSSLETNLEHMSSKHSFFVPDAEYLVDLPGLLTYLGEKIAVGNVCIYCNEKGREFRTLTAVRKHMLDKGHCKIAYDTEDDRLEVSDFYDFTSSYPTPKPKKAKAKKVKQAKASDGESEEDEEWEDASDADSDEVDEVVEESASEDSDEESSEEDSDLDENQVTYGDTNYELVLPSGARIGHRSMRRYYAQSFPGSPRGSKPEDPNSGAALVRRLLAEKNSALVPRRGGFGAFGAGTDVVKARNAGEARNAGRHMREFRDIKRRQDFKTKVGFIHNNQKHFRDPLLQVHVQ
ncbi:hypothetical protein PUNSTDRAFT_111550 [Punctularia strigosozonata HHB-11173 SS5]|uniref:uncharacterized protein n=1 Tax=Punctularia strigosozonata (strain HHB-11173) TaxID=741275 RepID=UPI0004417A0A|nr:uncharacterized protein PUNSTDRAFT_111550 [Punctularia strigosozonata HHB-11173 SS5]EIN11378.1 hypothetical protein PUNSTDRAFT_111550 [Punctularia strigosozonata HHB-11173 SS5]